MKHFFIKRTISVSLLSMLVASVLISAPAAAADEPFRFEEITLQQLQTGYTNKVYTAEEVVKAYLDRINTYEPNYNAFTFMNPKALEQAIEIDRRRAAGETLGKLAGVPIVIKEAVDVAGFPSTMGWAPLSKEKGGIELVPEKDAPVVARLKSAGAIILGKTNIPAFSSSGTRATTSWDGDTYNAVDRKIVPGASSSGTATSVSGNMALLGIAEETGGSIQNPAAAQALVGIKPTFGLVPNVGVVPLAGSTKDVIGPHARTVHDAAVMLDVIAGYSYEDPKTVASIGNIPSGGYTSELSTFSLKGKRIGLYGLGWRDQELSPETQKLYDLAVVELEKQGATVVPDPFAGTEFAAYVKAAGSVGSDSVIFDMQKYLERLGPDSPIKSVKEMYDKTGLKPPVFDRYKDNLPDPYSVADFSNFVQVRTKLLQIINDVMDENKLDAFVYPQMFMETPLLESKDNIGATTVSEINTAGVPLVTVPAGYYQSGSPFSLAFTGKMWSEAGLIGMAYDYEQATKYRVPPILIKKP
ncbi:amidase [Paenibacillus agricola]|uniref:Amidase n=1 Tax=Paenibacillus agricola TaxID=2716264 RepID=A0ABX0JCG2_9BACL|nr:amidase [Paenibacillus agricola]NHN34190.1 amidase [Paenibacillus agricola]